MKLILRILFHNSVMTLLVAVAFSETLIANWLLLSGGLPPLGWLGSGFAIPVLAAFNLGAMLLLRTYSRRLRFAHLSGRIFMVGSLGALFTGPPLLAVFALVGPLAWIGDGGQGVQAALVGGGGIAMMLGFGPILWGFLVGQRRVQVEGVSIEIADLPEALAGLRVAHLTDLHIGMQLRSERLRRFVERVNSLEPDLIVITGDIFDYDPALIEEGCRELDKLSARFGVLAILGNHDVYTGPDKVAEGIRGLTSIQLLRDEWTLLEIHGETLYVVGLDDPGRGWRNLDSRSDALERMVAELPQVPARLLLAHRPSYFAHAVELGLPLMLAGHTHGGQITLPGRAAHWNVSRMVSRWTRGLFRSGQSQIYVNRGLGIVGPPVRLNCPREIALLTLQSVRTSDAT